MQKVASNIAALAALCALCLNAYGWSTNRVSIEATIFGQNLLWTVASLSVGFLYLRMLRTAQGESRWLMTGIVLVSMGTGLHRGYYTLWRWLRENDFGTVQQAQLDYAWLLIFPITLALVGYAYHSRPVIERVSGDRWVLDFLSAAVLLWTVAVWWIA